jgi:hypothetical protein
MADVKICDRCGKTIDDHVVIRNLFKAWRYSLFSPDVSHALVSDWDLCCDCGKKLERFLKGEELVKDAQKTDEKLDDALIIAR